MKLEFITILWFPRILAIIYAVSEILAFYIALRHEVIMISDYILTNRNPT